MTIDLPWWVTTMNADYGSPHKSLVIAMLPYVIKTEQHNKCPQWILTMSHHFGHPEQSAQCYSVTRKGHNNVPSQSVCLCPTTYSTIESLMLKPANFFSSSSEPTGSTFAICRSCLPSRKSAPQQPVRLCAQTQQQSSSAAKYFNPETISLLTAKSLKQGIPALLQQPGEDTQAICCCVLRSGRSVKGQKLRRAKATNKRKVMSRPFIPTSNCTHWQTANMLCQAWCLPCQEPVSHLSLWEVSQQYLLDVRQVLVLWAPVYELVVLLATKHCWSAQVDATLLDRPQEFIRGTAHHYTIWMPQL